jgi:hypothetical protein
VRAVPTIGDGDELQLAEDDRDEPGGGVVLRRHGDVRRIANE